jgi:hypothetical protein
LVLREAVKQPSVFLAHEREQVYTLFEKYLLFLNENDYYDLNMVAYRNFGMSPLLMALQQAHNHVGFLESRLPSLYPKLRPETIKIKIDNQLVKISARSAEFFLMQNFIVTQTKLLMEKSDFDDKGLSMDNVTDICQKFPDNILPEFRKKRQYLNAILSKNEIDRVDPYGKKLFLRIGRGVYVLNPNLEILIAEDQWLNVYDMMFTEKMTRERNETLKQEALIRHRQQWEENREKARLKVEADRKRRLEDWHNQWKF